MAIADGFAATCSVAAAERQQPLPLPVRFPIFQGARRRSRFKGINLISPAADCFQIFARLLQLLGRETLAGKFRSLLKPAMRSRIESQADFGWNHLADVGVFFGDN